MGDTFLRPMLCNVYRGDRRNDLLRYSAMECSPIPNLSKRMLAFAVGMLGAANQHLKIYEQFPTFDRIFSQ
jgi:hypothetical protein